jgi:hypothetical protein
LQGAQVAAATNAQFEYARIVSRGLIGKPVPWLDELLSKDRCAGAFRAEKMRIWQFVFSKGGIPGGYAFGHLAHL